MSTARFTFDPPSEYYSPSGGGFTLRANPEVLGTLDALVREGVSALRRRGLEIGGLLLGSDASDVSLDAVRAITIEHRFGPSYQLSDSDIELTRKTIDQLREQLGPRIIGHFRSCTGGEFAVTAADVTLAALTGVPQPLMLLIKGSLTEPNLARLYRNSNGEFVELLEFPLGRPTAERPVPRPFEGPLNETASTATRSEIVPDPPASVSPVRRNSAARRIWRNALLITGLLACAALVSYSVVYKLRSRSPDSANNIGLSVRRANGQLIVNWDRSSPTVRNGISGVLTIQDGSYQHRFPLTSSELLSDTVSYAPETEAVEFRLEVYRDRYRHTDDRIVVFADPSQSPAEHAALDGIADRVVVDVDVAKQNQRNKVNRPRAGRFRPAERPAPVLPRRSVPLPIPAASDSRLRPPPALSYEAVVPVRRAIPAVPRNLRALISERISVAVKVVVDAAGEVISAKALNPSGSGRKLLNDCAVQAAMLWRFEPARRDGQPVGSEAVVTFNFEPQTP